MKKDSGSTALILIIKKTHFVIINLGDSLISLIN
jgi:hypothetical protein